MLSYALLRLGLPLHLVRFQIRWLEQAQYFLKVQNSFTDPYSTNNKVYLFGTGQGTGWSPPNWSALSDLISKTMSKHVPGLRLMHPDGSFFERIMDAFVDDVNSGLEEEALKAFKPDLLPPVPKMDTIYDQTQENMQFYSNVLFTTGGKLALNKCFIYLLIMCWQQGYRHYEETQLQYPPIQIHQGMNQNKENIRLVSPSESRKMLGVYTAPNGSSSKQCDVLVKKIKKMEHLCSSQSSSTIRTHDVIFTRNLQNIGISTRAQFIG